MTSLDRTLRLEPVAGPPLAAPVVSPDRPAVVGRAVGSDVLLLSEGVSRRHAMIEHQSGTRAGHGSTTTASISGRWYITDLNSSPGTFVNGVRLAADSPTALASGDLVRIGPWTFRMMIGGAAAPSASPAGSRVTARTLDDTRSGSALPASSTSPAANQRLDQLIECTLTLMDAPDTGAMARVVLEAALTGTGFTRGAVLSCPSDDVEVEIVQSSGGSPEDWRRAGLSRSLIREAAAGHSASIIERDAPATQVSSHTMGELRIHSAVCVPVMVGPTVVSLLYLDARGEESRVGVRADAESFCAALARMFGMAIGNAMRAEIDQRRVALESDLGAAREAQQLVMPPPDATLAGGRVRYAVRNIPGRFVAGDLFDAIDLSGGAAGRVAIAIGDVSGEGAGSAIVMASTQAYLHAALRREPDLAAAVRELNRYVCQHSPLDRFVSAWVGIIDLGTRTLAFIDAGHGHWGVRRTSGTIEQPRGGEGIPLGIEPEYPYECGTLTIGPGDRVLLYSDGLSEQRAPTGEEFGTGRIAGIIAAALSATEDADSLVRHVQHHAARPFLDDDTTVASVEILA
jgi:serine phosphatase RsbU (regulator of sigma subunit)